MNASTYVSRPYGLQSRSGYQITWLSPQMSQPPNSLGYIIFMLISMSFIYIRPHRLQTLLYVSAPIVMVFIVVLLIWSLATMGPQGFGETISMSSGWNILLGNLVTLFRVKSSYFPLMLSLAVSLESLLRERPNDDTDKPIGTCPTFFGQ